MDSNRFIAALLAAFAALSGIPLALAQLDFAGVVNVFRIDAGDVVPGLLLMAGVGGVLTCAVIAIALIGAVLCLVGSPAARPILLAAAIAGFGTALLPWLPNAVALGIAWYLLDESREVERDPQVA